MVIVGDYIIGGYRCTTALNFYTFEMFINNIKQVGTVLKDPLVTYIKRV